jgi:hypothetical protein
MSNHGRELMDPKGGEEEEAWWELIFVFVPETDHLWKKSDLTKGEAGYDLMNYTNVRRTTLLLIPSTIQEGGWVLLLLLPTLGIWRRERGGLK